MSKALFITEKPSVAMEFAKVLGIKGERKDGFIESEKAVVTWCVGHLVNMSYPECYDEKYKKWSLNTLPFLPQEYKYEVIKAVKKQFEVVKKQLTRADVSTIYVCTDSGREGEYIYRLVDRLVNVNGKEKKRVWIDSQTEDEIRRGVREAKPLSDYDALSESAYLRAKEDYLIGINFSRVLSLTYGGEAGRFLGRQYAVVAVGRVMSCVLGMVVRREREIREFVKTNYYKIIGSFNKVDSEINYDGEWKAVEGTRLFMSGLLFNETGFKKREDAEKFIAELNGKDGIVDEVKKKEEKKNAPLLFNLAELQSECTKRFKISPDKTLQVVQSLYEKKMVTYPRTDARVLSTAVAKEIDKNIKGLVKLNEIASIAQNILNNNLYKGLEKTKYVNDSAITDHYAIVPTGQGIENYDSLGSVEKGIYVLVVRRFLAVFYPPAVYKKLSIISNVDNEKFFTSSKVCISRGYLDVLKAYEDPKEKDEKVYNMEDLNKLKKGDKLKIEGFNIKEAETSPPNRYTTGSIILAMENAGKLIEDEELREQIKSSGIGTSATRAEILKKLEKNEYIQSNKKTQILTPTVFGEVIYEIVSNSITALLNPELTASWEKGLSMVANGEIKSEEYMIKMEKFIISNTQKVMKLNNKGKLIELFNKIPKDNVKSNKSQQDKLKENVAKNDIPKNKVSINNQENDFGVCPLCKSGKVIKTGKGFLCSEKDSGCKFFISEICGKKITEAQVKKLIEGKSTNVIKGFKSKNGKPFDARLQILDGKLQFDFV